MAYTIFQSTLTTYSEHNKFHHISPGMYVTLTVTSSATIFPCALPKTIVDAPCFMTLAATNIACSACVDSAVVHSKNKSCCIGSKIYHSKTLIGMMKKSKFKIYILVCLAEKNIKICSLISKDLFFRRNNQYQFIHISNFKSKCFFVCSISNHTNFLLLQTTLLSIEKQIGDEYYCDACYYFQFTHNTVK